jgi:hypothetical protein
MRAHEDAIAHGEKVGGVEGVLLALGPDLTVAEWSRALNMSLSSTRRAVQIAGVSTRRDSLADAAREALRALAFGDTHEARRLLRDGLDNE